MLGGLAGLFSLEISQIPSAASHRVRRRLAVYDGGQVDGNGLPRFGSLSSTTSVAATTCSEVFGWHRAGWLFAWFLPCAYRGKVQKNLGPPAVDICASYWSSLVHEVGVESARVLVGGGYFCKSPVSTIFIACGGGPHVNRTRYPWMRSPHVSNHVWGRGTVASRILAQQGTRSPDAEGQ